MKYCVIDISSTSISLIAAEHDGSEINVSFRDRASLTLVHYMDGRKLSARGVDKLVAAVRVMQEKGRKLGADELYLISTAALRSMENFEEAGKEVLVRTGVPVNFISGETEAYCDYVANTRYSMYPDTVLLDVGGASMEVCALDGGKRHYFDFGLIHLHDKFVARIQPEEKEAKRIKKYLEHRFDKEELPAEGEVSTLVTVGANANALYDLYAELYGTQEDGVRAMKYKKFKKLTQHLISGHDRSRLILDAAPEKLYSVGIAAIVTRTLAKRFGTKDILVSDHGVKEGYLRLILSGELIGAPYHYTDAEEAYFYDAAEETLPALEVTEEEEVVPAAEEVTEVETPAENAPKRHPGRPRKQKTEEELAAENAPKRHPGRPRKQKTEEELAAENAPKRHPGRPRKQKTEEELAAENAPKRHPGRPRKQKTEEELAAENAPKRHRGRPRKQKTEEELAAENAPKRHRGRPRKRTEEVEEGGNQDKEKGQE